MVNDMGGFMSGHHATTMFVFNGKFFWGGSLIQVNSQEPLKKFEYEIVWGRLPGSVEPQVLFMFHAKSNQASRI